VNAAIVPLPRRGRPGFHLADQVDLGSQRQHLQRGNYTDRSSARLSPSPKTNSLRPIFEPCTASGPVQRLQGSQVEHNIKHGRPAGAEDRKPATRRVREEGGGRRPEEGWRWRRRCQLLQHKRATCGHGQGGRRTARRGRGRQHPHTRRVGVVPTDGRGVAEEVTVVEASGRGAPTAEDIQGQAQATGRRREAAAGTNRPRPSPGKLRPSKRRGGGGDDGLRPPRLGIADRPGGGVTQGSPTPDLELAGGPRRRWCGERIQCHWPHPA
jgi:hypothetical protein